MSELFARHEENPILTAADWPYEVNTVFNPGVAHFEGETLLLARVEDRTGISHLAVATSADGVTGWQIDPQRALTPDLDLETEQYGIEDPRITRLGDEWLILYTGYSSRGPLVCLASTRDFRTYERRGVLLPPEDKDAALFSERVEGRYAMIHRPFAHTGGHAHICFCRSPDLVHWATYGVLLPTGDGGSWEGHKVGLGPPPLLTDDGWLVAYHGVKQTASGSIYRIGLALLDADRPERVLARTRSWVFGPQAPYERSGDVDNVVFPCGWLLDDDGDTIRMYYGAADTSICLATASLAALLERLRRES
jgi:beta-1,4-mannooligosaccharide/beta-1,4-mannosyl-N-acetylglucosamine phosphorylase